METALVMLIVAGCTGYAAWTLMPSSAQRALVQAAGRLPRLQRLLRKNATTGACGGCDSCESTPAAPETKPVILHRRPRH